MSNPQLAGAGFYRPLRIGLALLIILTGAVFAYMLLAGTLRTHAAPPAAPSELPLPGSLPWGLGFDNNGNVWVAETGCDPKPYVCATSVGGSIAQVDRTAFTVKTKYSEPPGYSSPFFVASDAHGNVWFSEPNTNSIGELTPGANGGTWHQWPVPTAKVVPFDLTFDGQGKLWFTEVMANKIGEFDPSTSQFVAETPTPTGNSNPYGITGPDPATGAIWFTENSTAVAQIGSFVPPTGGPLSTTSIKEYPTHSANATPHRITFDGFGNIWWGEGPNGMVGRLVISQAQAGTKNGITEYRTPPCSGCSTHISGVAVDGSGTAWVDDSLGGRVMYLPSNSTTFGVITLSSNAHPHDGLAIDNNNDVFFSEEFANKLGKIAQPGLPAPAPTGTGTTTKAPSTPPGPVNTKWYFAEGRVGKGFREYLTIDNPSNATCPLSIQYQYMLDGSSTPAAKTITANVGPYTRLTEPVNADLHIPDGSATAASLSAIVNVTGSCNGVMAERPIYFTNYHGLSSGTDAAGMTKLSNNFAFADVPTGGGASSFITILNPNSSSASVTATYYANGQQVGQQKLMVPANARGTISPDAIALPRHVAATVSSTVPVMAERPSYFSNVNGVSGAADVIGATSPGKDWLFAEGYAASNSQEYLTIANVDPINTSAAVTVTLKSRSGTTKAFNLPVAAHSQVIWGVNNNDTFPNATPEVSAEVTSTGANIVVQREMYFQYHHSLPQGTMQANCVTDVMGLPAVDLSNSYSFAEGYTNRGYNTWLTVQNPTNVAENISVTLVNGDGRWFVGTFQVTANSRATVDVTAQVQTNLHAASSTTANAVSMTVQTLNNGGKFIAERPLYWNTANISSFVTQGGSDIIGY